MNVSHVGVFLSIAVFSPERTDIRAKVAFVYQLQGLVR